MKLTRKEAEENEIYYQLMNFFIAYGRDISNWRTIQQKQFFNSNEMILYRGLTLTDKNKDTELFQSKEGTLININENRCTSWTIDPQIAIEFAEPVGIILQGNFKPNQLVFDTTYLDDDLFVSHKWQKEIVIAPGTFEVKILKQNNYIKIL